MDNPKQKSNKGLIIALIVMAVLFLLVSAVFAYFYFFKGNSLKTFNIDNVDPSIANKLSGSIIYSSDREENAPYFSPNLELTLTYDEGLYSITEGTDSISINPRNYEEYTSAYLKVSQSTDIKGLLLETSYLKDLTFVSEDTEGDVKKLLFTYEQPSLADSTKTAIKHISVFYRTFNDNQTVYVEIKDFNYTENQEMTTAFENIVNSVSFDLTDVEQELQAQIDDGTVNIKFDRTLWSITFQSEQNLSMSGQDDNTAGFSVNTFAAYNKDDVETTEGLRGQLDDHFDSKGGYFNDNDYLFEQIGDYETVEIGGIDFEKGTYKYNYGSEPTTVESYYVGYLPGKELQVYITTRYTDKENLEYISTLLDNIEITDEQLYSQLVDSSVLGTSNVSINPATILGQASTVRIYNQECNDYTFSGALSGLNVAGQTYTICSAGLGSGFVINSSGYIVTNSHVADPNDLKILYSGLSDDGIYESAILADLSYRLDLEYGPGFSYQLSNEDLFGYYVMFLYSLYDGGYVSASLNHRDLYVQGNEPFSFDDNTGALLNPLNHYKSDLVNSNKISSQADVYFNEEGSYTDVPDIAIIKTEETLNIPSIPLQYQGLVTGQKIYVIGYPGLVDNEKFIDTSNIFSSTVTQGTISAIKANSNNTFDLLQIDASVEHGNSGGPIVSDDGAVVGIATYAMASSSNGNYNAGVSGEAVEAFLKDSAVTASTNEEREVLEASLIDISNSYYSDAKEKLESLVDKQESLGVIINPFIELCDSKIAAGEDKTSVLDIDFTNWQTVIIPLMALILIVMIIILILLIGRNKKNRRVVSNPQQPAPQVQ